MRFSRLLLGLFLIAGAVSAEEMRMWKSSKGNTVDASFVKMSEKDPTRIVLKCKDGSEVTPKLADLCEADQAYVADVTYKPREVTVTFKRKRAYGGIYEESGVSQAATIRDTVTIQMEEQDGKKTDTVGDSIWKIESVNVLNTSLLPQKEGFGDKLDTKGKFVLVAYELRNMSKQPIRRVPPPVLVDKSGCNYTQLEKSSVNLRYYIPESVSLAGSDTLQPGMPQLFWSYYEMPLDAEPVSVEVFPLKTGSYEMERNDMKGKQMLISRGGAKAGTSRTPNPATANSSEKNGSVVAAPSTPDPVAPSASEKKVIVSLNVTKTKQGGDSRSNFVKTRSYTYQVDLRLLSSEVKQVPLTVKVFFSGAASDRRDLVVDRQEREVALEQNKSRSETFTSKEIRELRSSYFYYYDYTDNTRKRISGAQLNGVIVQVWAGSSFIKGISKGDNSLKKFEESLDVVKEMGEMKESTDGF